MQPACPLACTVHSRWARGERMSRRTGCGGIQLNRRLVRNSTAQRRLGPLFELDQCQPRWLSWIIVGAIAGWLAGLLVKGDEGLGVIGHVLLGLVGALLGGYVVSLSTNNDPMDGVFRHQHPRHGRHRRRSACPAGKHGDGSPTDGQWPRLAAELTCSAPATAGAARSRESGAPATSVRGRREARLVVRLP
jgi:uncharacterized membrane protein YeaQ/YmgE (transglycosylase-associated protein family)